MATESVEWLLQPDGTYYGVVVEGGKRGLGSIPARWEPGTKRPDWMPKQQTANRWVLPVTLAALTIAAGSLYYYYGME